MNGPVEAKTCSRCGAPLTPGALQGLCPRCLLALNIATQTEMTADAGEPQSAGPLPSFDPPALEEIARHFPGLEILELLGRGGMGAVYKARQKQLDRVVALKILPPRPGDDSAFAERFTREAKALAKLLHPNIVALFEFGQADGIYYLLMEYVDGVSLGQLMRSGRVAPREALAIVPQICDALQYAHDQGIVHRDIKPENIMLDRRGRVKVADFGLAKIIEGRDASPRRPGEAPRPAGPAVPTQLTEAGKIMGTPKYMSPEQIEAPGEVDHRADIYALGVVFYQMLTGELPGKPLVPPSRAGGNVQIDVRLDEVVLRALELKPELRYQQASILKTQVETIAATPERTAAPPAQPGADKNLKQQEVEALGQDVARLFSRHGLVALATQCVLLFDFTATVPGLVERDGRRRFNFWPFLLLFCSTIAFLVNGGTLLFSAAPRLWRGTPGSASVFPLTAQETSFLMWAVLGAVGRLAALNLGQAAKDITPRRVFVAFRRLVLLVVLGAGGALYGWWLSELSPSTELNVAHIAKWIGITILGGVLVAGGFFLTRFYAGVWRQVNTRIDASARSKGLSAAEVWLAVVDAGDYAQSWETGYFLRTIAKEEWVGRLDKVRGPLGRVLSRKLRSTEGAPSRRRFMAKFTFTTSFEGLPEATESLTMALEPNLGWKAVGYLIRPAEAPEPGPRTDEQALSLSDERKLRGQLKRQSMARLGWAGGSAERPSLGKAVGGPRAVTIAELATFASALLLLLAAWGNPTAMILIAALALVPGLLFLGKGAFRGALLVTLAAVGCGAGTLMLLPGKTQEPAAMPVPAATAPAVQPFLRATLRVLDMPASVKNRELRQPAALLQRSDVRVLTAPYVLVQNRGARNLKIPNDAGAVASGAGFSIVGGRVRTITVAPQLNGTSVEYSVMGLVSPEGESGKPTTWQELRNGKVRLGEFDLLDEHKVGNGRKQLAVLSFELEPPPAAEALALGPFFAQLPQGKFELVALSYHPSTNQPWWRPNGTAWTNGAFHNPTTHRSPTKGQRIEFVFRCRGLPKDTTLDCSFEPGTGEISQGDHPWSGERVMADYDVVTTVLPAAAKEVAVRVGVAAGGWKTLATRTSRGSTGGAFPLGDQTCKALFLEPVESDGEARAGVSYNKVHGWASRVSALDTSGQLHTSLPYGESLDDVATAEGRFPGLPLSRVKEFRFEVRPYQYVEFLHVSLKPGVRTHVEVVNDSGGESGEKADAAPAHAAKPADNLRPEDSSATQPTFGVAASGTAPLSYQWQFNTNAEAVLSAASGTNAASASSRLQFRWVAAAGDTNTPADELPEPNDRSGQATVRVLKDVVLDGSAVASAGFTAYRSDQKDILVVLTSEGARQFAQLTAANIGRRLAIVWKGRVLCAPVIVTAISTPRVTITGNMSAADCNELLDVLNKRPPAAGHSQPPPPGTGPRTNSATYSGPLTRLFHRSFKS